VADRSETTQVTSLPGTDESGVEPGTAEVLDAIRELSARVGNLQAEVQTLRTQARALPPGSAEAAGWDDARSGGADLLAWVRAIDSPVSRGPSISRLLLEIIFLVAVAVGAAIAELEAIGIAAVMGVAWALVAAAEFAAARAARRRAEAVYAPLPGLAAGFSSDPTWLAPPVERTALDAVESSEETQTKLPPPHQDS